MKFWLLEGVFKTLLCIGSPKNALEFWRFKLDRYIYMHYDNFT